MSTCISHNCGVDTMPHLGKWEFHSVTKDVWKLAGMPTSTVTDDAFDGNFLCISCLKLRTRRRLAALDFGPRNEPKHCEGGISTPGCFNVGVCFLTFEAALASERGFRDHGYVIEFINEIDDCSNATFPYDIAASRDRNMRRAF